MMHSHNRFWGGRGSAAFLALLMWGAGLAWAQTSAPPAEWMVGADISWVPQQEARGRRFSVDGREADVLAILKEHGFNWIRLRLFVDPTAPGGYSTNGYCGLESTLVMAQRVKKAGFKFLLNYHYSDTWADPAHQNKPAAWKRLDFSGLTNALYRYTRETLAAFKARGAPPEMVQVGNEISNGMVWPEGSLKNWDQFAALYRAGCRAVRDELPSAKVMLHLAMGGQNAQSRWFLDNARQRGMEFDVLGQSYYPRWHGTLEDLRQNLADLATHYAKPIVVVEHTSPGITNIFAIVRDLPGGKGWGAMIWEPTEPRHGNLFDAQGRSRETLKEYLRLPPPPERPSP